MRVTDSVSMRATAERRADGVDVAAGVELIEPESLHQSALAGRRVGDAEPGRTARRQAGLGNGQAPARSDRPSRLLPHRLYQDAGPQSVPLLRHLRRRLVHTPSPGLQARGQPSRYPHRRPALPCEAATTASSCPTVPPVRCADDAGRLLGPQWSRAGRRR